MKLMPLHRIQVRSAEGALEAMNRLVAHGHKPTATKLSDDCYAIDFGAPKDVNLDFLRPDVLPPEEGQ